MDTIICYRLGILEGWPQRRWVFPVAASTLWAPFDFTTNAGSVSESDQPQFKQRSGKEILPSWSFFWKLYGPYCPWIVRIDTHADVTKVNVTTTTRPISSLLLRGTSLIKITRYTPSPSTPTSFEIKLHNSHHTPMPLWQTTCLVPFLFRSNHGRHEWRKWCFPVMKRLCIF